MIQAFGLIACVSSTSVNNKSEKESKPPKIWWKHCSVYLAYMASKIWNIKQARFFYYRPFVDTFFKAWTKMPPNVAIMQVKCLFFSSSSLEICYLHHTMTSTLFHQMFSYAKRWLSFICLLFGCNKIRFHHIQLTPFENFEYMAAICWLFFGWMVRCSKTKTPVFSMYSLNSLSWVKPFT